MVTKRRTASGEARSRTEASARRSGKPGNGASKVTDLVREHRDAYGAGRDPALVDLAPALFLTATGQGDPNGPDFREAVGALYATAYTIKFARRASENSFKVAPLEGLWWGRAREGDFTGEPRETWNWQILIRVPGDVSQAELLAARAKLEAKGTAGIGRVALEIFHEGRAAQALHLGPYADERPTVERLHAFAHAQGLEFGGRHHEVYLSDPRRTPPARLKTILRVPVRAARVQGR